MRKNKKKVIINKLGDLEYYCEASCESGRTFKNFTLMEFNYFLFPYGKRFIHYTL